MPVEFVGCHQLVTSGNETKTLNKRCAFVPEQQKSCQTTSILHQLQVLDLPAGVPWFGHIALHRAHGDCLSDLLEGCSLRHVEEFHQKEPNRQRPLPLETVLCWGMDHVSGPSPPQRRFFRRTVLL